MARGVQLVRIGKRYFEYTLFFTKMQQSIKEKERFHKLFLKCLLELEGIKRQNTSLIRNAAKQKLLQIALTSVPLLRWSLNERRLDATQFLLK
jgi:hypothetical protein